VLTSNDAVKGAVKKEMLLIFNRLHRTVATNTLSAQMLSNYVSHSFLDSSFTSSHTCTV